MASKSKFVGHFVFTSFQAKRAKAAYAVSIEHPDGHREAIGTVIQKWFAHIERHGWEATASDGHRAVHTYRWQAAKALIIDLTNYPFPITGDAL